MGQHHSRKAGSLSVPVPSIGEVPYLAGNQPMRFPILAYVGYAQVNYTFSKTPAERSWNAALEKGYIEIYGPEIATAPAPKSIPNEGKIIYDSQYPCHKMEITSSVKTAKMMNDNIALQLNTMTAAVSNNGTVYFKSGGYIQYSIPVARFMAGGGKKGMRFGETDFFEPITVDTGDKKFRWLNSRIVLSQGRLLALKGQPYGIEYRLFTMVS
jgi:hypothetical protein